MNIQVLWEGTDITSSVIEYTREHDICTGNGTLDLNVQAKTSRDFQPWDTIVIYENSNKMGTYNIVSQEKTVPGAIYVISCQDDSKRLTDTFIDESYEITYPSTAKYWIEKFLDQAGVTYNFNVEGYGADLSENTTLGFSSVYDILIQMLQMSGWYYYFDENNVCQIGTLVTDSDPVRTYEADEILDIGYLKNDKMLRNRVVVWGASDKDGNWIFADTSKTTAWNRPGNDYRTVVYQNSAIKTFGVAYYLASLILAELSQTIPEKNLRVVGSDHSIHLGVVISGITNFITVRGKVTHYTVNVSSSGFTTTYTLDQRCPRMWGYATWNDYVYVGTNGDGVWRKYLLSSTWNNYSTGITDLDIKDLVAYDGLLGAVTQSGRIYTRHTSEGVWREYTPDPFVNNYAASGEITVLASGYLAENCSIDQTYGFNGIVTVGFTKPASGLPIDAVDDYFQKFPVSGNLSWVNGVTFNGQTIYSQQVYISPSGYTLASGLSPTDIAIYDMETNWDGKNIIGVYNGALSTASGEPIFGVPSGIIPGIEFGGSANMRALQFSTLPSFYSATPDSTAWTIEPSSGIYAEINYNANDNQYGGNVFREGQPWLFESDGASFHGNLLLVEDEATNGICYALGSYALREIKFVNIYDESYGDTYTNTRNYYWDTSPAFDDMSYVIHLYRIDATHFSIAHMNYNNSTLKIFFCETSVDPEIDGWEYGTINCTSTTTYDFTPGENHNVLPVSMVPGFDIYSDYGIYNAGGRYCAFLRIDSGEWVVSVVDMADGSKDDTNITANNGNTALVGNSHIQSPNYMLFGIMSYPPLTSSNSYTWYFIPIFVDKNDGSVSYGTTGCTVNGGTNFTTLSKNDDAKDNTWQKRINWFIPIWENPDTGVGESFIINGVSIHDEGVDEDWYCTAEIRVSNGGGGTATVYIDKFDGTTEELLSSSAPAWMSMPLQLEGASMNLRMSPTFSRNVSYTPMVWGTYFTTGYWVSGGSYVENVLVDSDDFMDYNTLDLDTTWHGSGSIQEVGSFMDDEDNILYIVIDSTTTGYNLDGSIDRLMFLHTYFYDYGGGSTYYGQEILAGGVPYQNKIFRTYYGDPNSVDIWYFGYPPTGILPETPGGRYKILLHDPKAVPSGLFTVIYDFPEGTKPLHIDASKGIPTVLYESHDNIATEGNSSQLGVSFTNERFSFDMVYPNANIQDVRVFDLTDPLGMFPASGVPSGFLDRYIGVAAKSKGALMYPATLPDGTYTELTISGVFTHIDFTNNSPDPYMFVSTSGSAPGSGRFYQRDTEEFFWNDYSATLPSGYKITVIRADDRM